MTWRRRKPPTATEKLLLKQLYDTYAAFDNLTELVAVTARLDEAAKQLRLDADVAAELASMDRKQLHRLTDLLNRLEEQMVHGLATVSRIESAAGVVATNLVTAQSAVDGVASDLADAHARADKVQGDADPGTAADAAAISPPDNGKAS